MKLTSLPEQALGTLFSRAAIGNEEAIKLRDKLVALGVPEQFEYAHGAVYRYNLIKQIVSEALSNNPKAKVLSLGAGFSTYYQEVGTKDCHWYEVDLPETIKIKREFFPETTHYTLIGADLNQTEVYNDVFSFNNFRTNIIDPDLVIAEGVIMYLEKDKAKEFLIRQNAHTLVDVLGSNRKAPLGPYHKWLYELNEWDLNISNAWLFDKKDSWLYQLNKKPNRKTK